MRFININTGEIIDADNVVAKADYYVVGEEGNKRVLHKSLFQVLS